MRTLFSMMDGAYMMPEVFPTLQGEDLFLYEVLANLKSGMSELTAMKGSPSPLVQNL